MLLSLLCPLRPLPLPLLVRRRLRMRRRRPLPDKVTQRQPLLQGFLSQKRRRHAIGRRGCRLQLLPPPPASSAAPRPEPHAARRMREGSAAVLRSLDEAKAACGASQNPNRAPTASPASSFPPGPSSPPSPGTAVSSSDPYPGSFSAAHAHSRVRVCAVREQQPEHPQRCIIRHMHPERRHCP